MKEGTPSRVFVVLPCHTQQYGKSCHTLFWYGHQCSKGVAQDLFILGGEKGLLYYLFSC